MFDPDQSEQWPPRWDPPPPLATPPPAQASTEATPALDAPRREAARVGSDPLPTYALPPDMPAPPTREVRAAGPPGHPAPAPAPTGGGHRSRPMLVVLAAVAAAVLGVGATLAIVQPWAVTATPTPNPPVTRTVLPPAQTASEAQEDPGEALRAQLTADRAAMAAVPAGDWVPQLSSKRVGLVADGVTYSDETIWADHRNLRGRFPGAALIWSGDYATFAGQDFWVTVMPPAASNSPDTANAWCDEQGFEPDDCYAKRISTSRYNQNTKHR